MWLDDVASVGSPPFIKAAIIVLRVDLVLGFLGALRLRGGILRGGIFRHERPVRVDRVCIPLAFEARAPDRRVNGSRGLLLGSKDADVDPVQIEGDRRP